MLNKKEKLVTAILVTAVMFVVILMRCFPLASHALTKQATIQNENNKIIPTKITPALPVLPSELKKGQTESKHVSTYLQTKSKLVMQVPPSQLAAYVPPKERTQPSIHLNLNKSPAKASVPSFQLLHKKEQPNAVKMDVKINKKDVKNQEIISHAKQINERNKANVTIQYSVQATVSMNNKLYKGELTRTYQENAQPTTSDVIDYNVVQANLTNQQVKLDIISTLSTADTVMYKVAKDISSSTKNINNNIKQTEIYFYQKNEDVKSNNFTWKYSDSLPHAITRRETFTY
ncbi:hypothetical protein PP175_28325 (plasmid) [Aneurinibacillus sp. Ricciae_BoGa-3]|uniref:hypothetical protein n=1 Tax=Aneurinibacillus sp. Ricciae_BoGa-3 TaxID=3022697 RepID=UPI0023400A70|nr:hypothetical protein [Aneurinibacillus sp. Ricciae_BoGa-3]WCK57098.1 hypothetical protein PP175_28325 [Aneurinibacillus sp. Ricciae_BoGa-3]